MRLRALAVPVAASAGTALAAGVLVLGGGASLAGLATATPVLEVGGSPAHAPLAVPLRVTATVGHGEAVDPGWLRRTASRTGIPAPALLAYADASLHSPCRVPWTTLAGIGWVESQHGTIGGRVLDAGGRSDHAVRGPALDGSDHVAAIRGSDGGWERAVGPMQFLPSTWARWGTDGDGDGRADPDDLDDAAAAADRYLCASGVDLASGPGWARAVLSYNHSDAYVRSVWTAATAYAARAAG